MRQTQPSPQYLRVVEGCGLAGLFTQTRIPAAAEQSLTDVWRKASLEDDIPERTCDPISRIDSLRTVMIKMVLLDVPEVTVIEVVVVL